MDRGSPEHQEKQNGGKQGKTRAGIGHMTVHQEATQHRPASNVARLGRAGWHDRARCANAGFMRVRDFRLFKCGFHSLLGDLS